MNWIKGDQQVKITISWTKGDFFILTTFIILFIISSIILSSTTLKAANDQPELKHPQEKTLHITSDSMLAQKESNTITFSGNVVATQGDSVIKADTISVFLFTDKEKKETPTDNKQDIKSMKASGNVQFLSGNRTAFADQAIYSAIEQKIILTGDAPRVMTGESYVTGKKIILFQDSGKVIVEGGKEQRVEALFNSKDDFKNSAKTFQQKNNSQ